MRAATLLAMAANSAPVQAAGQVPLHRHGSGPGGNCRSLLRDGYRSIPRGSCHPRHSHIPPGTTPAALGTPAPLPPGCSGTRRYSPGPGTCQVSSHGTCGLERRLQAAAGGQPQPAAVTKQQPQPHSPESIAKQAVHAASPVPHLSGSDCARPTAASTCSIRCAAAAAMSASSFSRSCSLPRMTAVSFSCLHNNERIGTTCKLLLLLAQKDSGVLLLPAWGTK